MSVHIKCDRCGAVDDRHWRNLDVKVTRGGYASTVAPEYTAPWNLNAHICGHCAATLRNWWNDDTRDAS
jgi:hypothetical protein